MKQKIALRALGNRFAIFQRIASKPSIVIASICGAFAATVAAQVVTNAPRPPESLKNVSVPEPSNLSNYVANKSEAIALGKALFWDMQVGSDGVTACASCHFHAGADTRSKNQVSPGLLAGDKTFQIGGPNYQLSASDFPLHKLSDPNNASSTVLRSVNDTVSSQGVFSESFVSVSRGASEDTRNVTPDPVFHVNGINTRRVEPRNSPSVINAVFNLRNFWDGRAQTIFNGVSGDGKRDTAARVYKSYPIWTLSGTKYELFATKEEINDSSLASQAVGPPTSDFEMSAVGRSFPDVGRRLLGVHPLNGQTISSSDSVLGSRAVSGGYGTTTKTYEDWIKVAFKPEWWNGTAQATINGKKYSHMEANFSLYFGLALQAYQATLVSSSTPFDSHAEGNSSALSAQQKEGLSVFWGKGKCANCHGGAEFTNASIRRKLLFTDRMSDMVMGDGGKAVYDEGYYNIGITKTNDDIGVGGKDKFGNPLSYSELAKQLKFGLYEDGVQNASVFLWTRTAVNGAFKTPGLRNVELTAPYFHNGGAATLMQVVEFYNRGGNFAANNRANLDADIHPLGLSESEKLALVAFLKSLTDERVRKHAAPFDHPELMVVNGHQGSTSSVINDGRGRAKDSWLTLPAVGNSGYASGNIPAPFLGIQQ